MFTYTPHCNKQNVCTIKIELTEEIQGPVLFHYGIKSFFQNYREF